MSSGSIVPLPEIHQTEYNPSLDDVAISLLSTHTECGLYAPISCILVNSGRLLATSSI